LDIGIITRTFQSSLFRLGDRYYAAMLDEVTFQKSCVYRWGFYEAGNVGSISVVNKGFPSHYWELVGLIKCEDVLIVCCVRRIFNLT
jgi:hypothetical protein